MNILAVRPWKGKSTPYGNPKVPILRLDKKGSLCSCSWGKAEGHRLCSVALFYLNDSSRNTTWDFTVI